MHKFTLNLFFILLVFSITSCGYQSPSSIVDDADELIAKQNYREAIYHYQRAIQKDPHNIVYYFNQAALFRKIGSFQRARKNYKIIRQVNPSLPHSAYGLARLDFEEKKFYKVPKLLVSQMNYSKENYPVIYTKILYVLGRSFLELKSTPNALKVFKQLQEQKDAPLDSSYYMGLLYETQLNDPNRATEQFQKYLSNGGADPFILEDIKKRGILMAKEGS